MRVVHDNVRQCIYYSNTESSLYVGSEVTYHCDDGLFPTGVMTSTCTDGGGRGEWVPDPAQLINRYAR